MRPFGKEGGTISLNLLTEGGDGLKKRVESVLNQVLEAQMTEHLGADRHERTEERAGYRNGVRERTLTTRVGTVILRVPQTRDGSFSTDLFKRYQRSEQALVLSMMEMVVQGVSTRKVANITEELCGTRFSKSTVSQLSTGLSARVQAWKNRKLSSPYPFVLIDALVIRVRKNESVSPMAALIATGITAEVSIGLKITPFIGFEKYPPLIFKESLFLVHPDVGTRVRISAFP